MRFYAHAIVACMCAISLLDPEPVSAQCGAHGDILVGRTASGQLAVASAEFELGVPVTVCPVDGLLQGFTNGDPGFDAEEVVPDPGNDFFPLETGAAVRIESIALDPAFKAWGAGLATLIDAPGEQIVLGDANLHEHLTWHVDSQDAGFDDGQFTWTVIFKLVDTGITGYADSEPFVMTFVRSDLGDCPAADCADVESDGVRDDNCRWWSCIAGTCSATDIVFADMGGAFGACYPDGFVNVHDKNHALLCFSGADSCEAINVDAGGAFGACPPDGFCNIHDANHALSGFSGTNTCSCPGGAAPDAPPGIVGKARLRAVLSEHRVQPGNDIRARVFVDYTAAPIRSYQLATRFVGGRSGEVRLLGIEIEDRRDWVFAGHAGAFEAFNLMTAEMLSGLDANTGATVTGQGYLATFIYRVSQDAAGTFVLDVATGMDSQTFLVAPDDGEIVITNTAPAVLTVGGARRAMR